MPQQTKGTAAEDDYDPDFRLPPVDADKLYGKGASQNPRIMKMLTEVRQEMLRRYHAEHPGRPLDLIPEDEANDTYGSPIPRFPNEGRGPTSSAIAGCLSSCCAGWKVQPTAAEFYKAARARNPGNRQKAILAVLLREGTQNDWLQAWSEGAFTWRQMIRAGHAICKPPRDLIPWINLMAADRGNRAPLINTIERNEPAD